MNDDAKTQMSEAYKVRLDSFEGPLDLLLHLIEKNRIDIYDIPIALLTEQYMEYLSRFKQFNIEVASEFIVMAATLLQIKSRILLPDAPSAPEDDADDENIDPRQELVERLLEYRRYKEVSALMSEMAKEAGKRYFRVGTLAPVKHLPPQNLDLQLLYAAFQNVMRAQAEVEETTASLTRERYTIEDKISSLLDLLQKNKGSICFNTAFSNQMPKEELITTFLAMLELIKLKRITVYQTGLFSPIYLRLSEAPQK